MVTGGRPAFDRVKVELPVWHPEVWDRTSLLSQAQKVQEEAAEVMAAAQPTGEPTQALAVEVLDVVQGGFTMLGMLATRGVDLQDAFRAFLEKNLNRGYYPGSYSGHQWEHLFEAHTDPGGRQAQGPRVGPTATVDPRGPLAGTRGGGSGLGPWLGPEPSVRRGGVEVHRGDE